MMRGTTVAGGKRGDATWNAFAGIPCQVDSGKKTPGTLSREYRGRWEAGKDTWNTFAGIPWQVGGGEMPPGTLSRENRGRWTAGRDTWNTFEGKPWQVDGRKGHLEHFCRDSVAGGRQEVTPGTLSREFRGRWTAGKDTWNTFAGIPCQVGSGMGHLEHFRRDSVAGGRREETPGTLSREFCARCVPHLQGHTVALRRSFPQCGPLPFSGADAGFGLCMFLASRFLLTPDVLT